MHPRISARREAVKTERDDKRQREIEQRNAHRLREQYSLMPVLQQSVDFAEKYGRLPTGKDIEPPPSAA